MKKQILISTLITLGAGTKAQVAESASQKTVEYVTDKFPFTRLVNAEFRNNAPYKYDSKLKDGTKLSTGKVTRSYQTTVSANINFVKTRKWLVSTGIAYNYLHLETDAGGVGPGKNDLHYYSAGVSVSRLSTLFGKTVIYSASVIPSGGNDGFERVTGLVAANLVLKADETTKMTVGLLGLVDPSSVVPFTPTFTYEKHLENGWIIDIILPQRVLMKKDVFTEGRVSIGAELNTGNFYIKDRNGSNKTFMLNQMDIMSGVTYEHNVFNHFIATFKTGVTLVPISRIAEVNKSFNKYVFSSQPDPSFYFNIGLSYKL